MNIYLKKIALYILFSVLFTLQSCGQKQDETDRADTLKRVELSTIKGNFSSQMRTSFDSVQINSFLEEYPKLKRYETDIRNFYRKRNFSYAWFEDGHLIEQSGNLINRVMTLENDGVFKKLFYADILDSLTHSPDIDSKSSKFNIKIELLLTGEYFVFSNLAWEGMNPFVSKSNDWLLPRKKIDYAVYLDSLLKSPTQNLFTNEPVYRQYELLKSNLKKYRILEQKTDWELINANAKAIKAKDSALVISQVKKRLFLLEDYQGQLLDTLFDAELNLALIRFQERHGIAQSGKINRETIVELNVPLKSRIKQILVNMERSRWLPLSTQGDYLAVNIPEFKLHVYHGKELLWSCNAVVGKTVHVTTLFYGEINQVVFSPYWNVPESIVSKEILPGIRRDPDYLSKHQMESIGTRNGLPIIRQKPGMSNSLGLVKFLFPNSYSIYLHDTPSKSLFKETNRAFSHGCIRIAEPAKLADFLLKDQEKWDEHTIDSAMNSGKEKYVNLDKKVPVFITYFTAFVDRNNKLNFRKDIYKLDERLASMIISGDGEY
jgi:murein L,D-transpeptidase YcbB/YkuD